MLTIAHQETPAAGLHSRAERLAKLELEYRFDESFKRRGAAAKFLPEPVMPDPTSSRPWQPGKQLPEHLVRLCERRLLSAEEERHRFRRMNFAKYRADILRRKLDPAHPDQALVEQIEFLIGLALLDRNEIVTANTRLVVSIIKKFAGVVKSFDELLSEGIETLLRATEKFDYARGFRFSTYATTAVRRSLYRSLQTAQREMNRVSIGNQAAIEDCLQPDQASPEDELRRQQRQRALRELLRRLSQRERYILSRRYGLDGVGEGQTLQSLADELGVCKERVRQLEVKARDKIRLLARQQNLALDESP